MLNPLLVQLLYKSQSFLTHINHKVGHYTKSNFGLVIANIFLNKFKSIISVINASDAILAWKLHKPKNTTKHIDIFYSKTTWSLNSPSPLDIHRCKILPSNKKNIFYWIFNSFLIHIKRKTNINVKGVNTFHDQFSFSIFFLVFMLLVKYWWGFLATRNI